MEDLTYTIIIPAFNEEKIIASTIDKVHEFLLKQQKPFEMIIANDGSKDHTAEIVTTKIKHYKELRLVSNAVNMGRGAALTNAFRVAKGKIQIYIDADLAIDLDLFPKLMGALEQEGADIAIGSKHLPHSAVDYPPLRRLASKGYSSLTRIFLSSTIRDYQCGFKAFKKETLNKVLPYIKEKGWSWDTEIIVKAQWLGFKVVELPAKVINIYGRESKVHLFKDIKRMAQGIYRIWKDKRNFKPKDKQQIQ